MKKVLRVLMFLIMCGAIGGCILLFLQKQKIISDRDALIQQNSQLQQSIDAIGPLTTCYTVKTAVKPGDEVKLDNIVEMTVPVSNTSDNTITDINKFAGPTIKTLDKYYYKVAVKPNTPLTKDLVMQDYIESPVYERDLILPWKPIGLKVGDYIDVRVTLPGGELMRALTHKRVYMIFDNVVKLKLSEGELYVYETMLTDHQYFGSFGLKIFATKYIEPGLSEGDEPLPMYPVSQFAATLLNRDPEVVAKTDYVNTELRNYIEQMLLFYSNAQEGTVFPGLPTSTHESSEAGTLNTAQSLYIDTYYGEDGEPAAGVNDLSGTGADGNLDGYEDGKTSAGDGSIADLNTAVGEAGQDLEAATNTANDIQQNAQQSSQQNTTQETQPSSNTSTTVPETMGNVDSQGNRSNVSTQDKNEAKSSGNIFSDADDID